MADMKIMVINGPNINMLGIREPGVYGNKTYAELESEIERHCAERCNRNKSRRVHALQLCDTRRACGGMRPGN